MSADARQADAQVNELKEQKKQEKLEATGRELTRREEINRRLAASVVGFAGSGIKGEGTPSSIALENAKDISQSEGVETLSDRLRQAQIDRQINNVRSAAKSQKVMTILDTALTAYTLGADGPSGGGTPSWAQGGGAEVASSPYANNVGFFGG